VVTRPAPYGATDPGQMPHRCDEHCGEPCGASSHVLPVRGGTRHGGVV